MKNYIYIFVLVITEITNTRGIPTSSHLNMFFLLTRHIPCREIWPQLFLAMAIKSIYQPLRNGRIYTYIKHEYICRLICNLYIYICRHGGAFKKWCCWFLSWIIASINFEANTRVLQRSFPRVLLFIRLHLILSFRAKSIKRDVQCITERHNHRLTLRSKLKCTIP